MFGLRSLDNVDVTGRVTSENCSCCVRGHIICVRVSSKGNGTVISNGRPCVIRFRCSNYSVQGVAYDYCYANTYGRRFTTVLRLGRALGFVSRGCRSFSSNCFTVVDGGSLFGCTLGRGAPTEVAVNK